MIYSAHIEMQTLSYEQAVEDIAALVERSGAYFEQKNFSNYSSGYRHASYTVRVPAEQFADFCAQVGTLCHIHRLCGPPSIPLSFNLAIVLPRWNTYCVYCGTQGVSPRTPSIHRLQCGLPGYLILFAPHTFAPHRQLSSSNPPSPLVFLLISTHFTATLGIPLTPPTL